jgi:hypothetical protein
VPGGIRPAFLPVCFLGSDIAYISVLGEFRLRVCLRKETDNPLDLIRVMPAEGSARMGSVPCRWPPARPFIFLQRAGFCVPVREELVHGFCRQWRTDEECGTFGA